MSWKAHALSLCSLPQQVSLSWGNSGHAQECNTYSCLWKSLHTRGSYTSSISSFCSIVSRSEDLLPRLKLIFHSVYFSIWMWVMLLMRQTNCFPLIIEQMLHNPCEPLQPVFSFIFFFAGYLNKVWSWWYAHIKADCTGCCWAACSLQHTPETTKRTGAWV